MTIKSRILVENIKSNAVLRRFVIFLQRGLFPIADILVFAVWFSDVFSEFSSPNLLLLTKFFEFESFMDSSLRVSILLVCSLFASNNSFDSCLYVLCGLLKLELLFECLMQHSKKFLFLRNRLKFKIIHGIKNANKPK